MAVLVRCLISTILSEVGFKRNDGLVVGVG